MTKKEKALKTAAALEALYPKAICSLDYGVSPYKLLVMAILSAQCTDARVNIVSVPLFKKYPTPDLLAHSPKGELEDIIRSVGLYNSKAKNLRAACLLITEKHGGKVPREMSELLELPGVGRKVANLVRGDLYGLGGIVADTHCMRISCRIGLCSKRQPLTVEKELAAIVPTDMQSELCHRFVLFGRDICTARAPRCDECPLSDFCDKKDV